MSSGAPGGGRGAGIVVGTVVLVLVAVAVVVLPSLDADPLPYGIDSTSPSGYGALAGVLRAQGASVRSDRAAAIARRPGAPGDVVVVPVPGLANAAELRDLRAAAAAGSVVVFGSEPPEPGAAAEEGDRSALAGAIGPDDRVLADTPADPVRPGTCDIAELAGLGEIDAAFAVPLDAAGRPSCYGDGSTTLVTRETVGSGAVVTLGGPDLLVNARLWPAKEDGGRPLDNAALAVRLMGPPPGGAAAARSITFVDAIASPDAVQDGRRGVLSLLPLGVRLALAMAVGAFVLYAWSRARRLGAPVAERLPVEIAGAELVVAVGDLLRRGGSPDRAAAVLRDDVRRQLASRLGLGAGADPAVLAAAVANRTGRPPEEVVALLLDSPAGGPDDVVRLAGSLDRLRQEVLHDVVAT
ncbi:MAG: DUF4350 domain-containing protein [Microthrixaceae bacterium]